MPKYDKLVRDKIPDIMRAKKVEPTTHVATDEEYIVYLRAKLAEELAEYLDSDTDPAEELADVMEVVYALAEVAGTIPEELDAIRARKAAEKGAFKDRIILDEAP